MPSKTIVARPMHWLWPLLLLIGVITALLAWMVISLQSGRQSGWMALPVALEVVWMLRLGTFPRGRARSVVAVLATAVVVAAANWMIASAQFGLSMGMDPWSSAAKMSTGLAWTLTQLANGPLDLVCALLGLVLAAWLAR